MAGEGALTVVLRTLRPRLTPAAAFGSTLSVTIVLVVLPMPVAGALPGLLLACAVLQGAAVALAFRGACGTTAPPTRRAEQPPIPRPPAPRAAARTDAPRTA
ncbi:hypothetical protein [Streptomyces sp. NBC_01390]|uniref:hypothetical protein n=1 Tax=Streptomyces sp. NBC_01390 TaxID=2903850 RepID=UPI00386599A5